ncbi:MAG TPA: DUF192 domain-containing protein, partial [Candidatus Paceibacterota bacterium]
TPMPTNEPQSPEQRIVTVGDTSIYVDVADTEVSRERGLSGRDGLVPNSGMLFVFDNDGKWGIWMKDMKFSIDIVWLAQDGTVITIAPDTAPDTYPKAFYPTKPARYVVELPAGFAKAHSIQAGDRFTL